MASKYKPKIIISTYDDITNPYYGGGGAIAIHELAKRLSNKYNIIVISWNHSGNKEEEIDTIKYKRIGMSIFNPKLSMLLFNLLLPFIAITSHYDLWLESFTPPYSTAFLQIFTKKPVIGLVHMLSGKEMSRKYGIPFFIIENIGLKTYKYFIVLSKNVKTFIQKQNMSAQITIIPNGIEEVNRVSNDKPKKYVLFIGRIEINQKGIDILLNTWKQIKRKESLKLAIVGSGNPSEIKQLNELITHLHLKRDVCLFGKMKGSKKHNIFNDSLFLVLPSRFETYPLVALEALAYGLPLISFDIDGLKWVPKENSVKVKPFDEKMLILKMQQLIEDKNLRTKLMRGSDRLINSHSWITVTRKYIHKLDEVLAIHS